MHMSTKTMQTRACTRVVQGLNGLADHADETMVILTTSSCFMAEQQQETAAEAAEAQADSGPNI